MKLNCNLMTCPRCGAQISGFPCSECGFPETLYKPFRFCDGRSRQSFLKSFAALLQRTVN